MKQSMLDFEEFSSGMSLLDYATFIHVSHSYRVPLIGMDALLLFVFNYYACASCDILV